MTSGNCAPLSSALISLIRKQNDITADVAICEFIDNCLDYEAKNIAIEMGGMAVQVKDDGLGSSRVEPFFQLGNHFAEDKRKRIGRYGVGGKAAAVWFGDEIFVETCHGGVKRSGSLDIRYLLQSENWNCNPEACAAPNECGTTITIRELVRKKSPNSERLGLIYGPALRKGINITFNDKPLVAAEEPVLESVIEEDANDADGRSYRLRAGTVKELRGRKPGWTICLGDRVLQEGVAYGFGDFSFGSFYGVLELLDDGEAWSIDTHKRGVERDELEQFLARLVNEHQGVRGLLQATTHNDYEIELFSLRQSVNDLLAGKTEGRERRAEKVRNGESHAQGASQKRNVRDDVDVEREGKTLRRGGRVHPSISIDFCELKLPGDPMFSVSDMGRRGLKVLFNTHFPTFPIFFEAKPEYLAHIATLGASIHLGDPNARGKLFPDKSAEELIEQASDSLRKHFEGKL